MATIENKEPRRVSVFITVRLDSVTAAQAQEIEDKIRDVADDYPGSDVQAQRANERPARTV